MKGVHVLFAGITIVATMQLFLHLSLPRATRKQPRDTEDTEALLREVKELYKTVRRADEQLQKVRREGEPDTASDTDESSNAAEAESADDASSESEPGNHDNHDNDPQAVLSEHGAGGARHAHTQRTPQPPPSPSSDDEASSASASADSAASEESEASSSQGADDSDDDSETHINLGKVDALWTLPPKKAAKVDIATALSIHKIKTKFELDDSCTTNKDFQSSRSFHDFNGPKELGLSLPKMKPFDGEAKCDPSNYSPSETERATCEEFISNFENWQYLRPMSSILAKARTIKFMVQSTDPKVKFILKIPQHKFIVEPYSEYTAYETDKIIGTNRVPTTQWAKVPLSWFRASMALLMPAMYVQWVECFVFNHKDLKRVVKTWGEDSEKSIYLSAQLWMDGVHDLPRTALGLRHSTVKDGLDPAKEVKLEKVIEQWALQETSDLYVFDHIIGNSDRTLSKNAFAVGKCSQEGWECTTLSDRRKVPHMVFLDQGSSFYARGNAKTSVFKEDSKVCKFRRQTFSSITAFKEGDYLEKIKKLLPKNVGFWAGFREWQIEGAEQRVLSLSKHMQECKSKFANKIYLD